MDTVASFTISRALQPTGHATGTCRHVGLDYISCMLHLHHGVYAMCNKPDSEWMYCQFNVQLLPDNHLSITGI